MARCLYTFVQLGAGVGPGNVEGATLPQSEAPRCTVERFRTTMKTSISIVLGCSLVAFAAGPFVTDKTDPAAAGMNPARLARIPARMREFVIAGKTAGVVTLVARHGPACARFQRRFRWSPSKYGSHRVRLHREPYPASNGDGCARRKARSGSAGS